MIEFAQIKIILINTTHPGNIGAVARAMKNMGFKHLWLVSPKCLPMSEEAVARASGASDILDSMVVVETLDQALVDCHWVMGLSARTRKIALPTLTARSAALQIAEECAKAANLKPRLKIALVFGQEQSGLSNEELDKCHYQITIPANPEYPSLNLGQAVQIVTYELRTAILSLKSSNFLKYEDISINNDDAETEKSESNLATIGEIERFYEHLEKTLIQIKFLDPKLPGYLMRHLRRLYAKSQLTRVELNILHGILTATEKGV